MQMAAEQLKAKFNFKLDDPTEDEPIEFAQESAAADLEDWLSVPDFALFKSEADNISDDDKKKQKRIVTAHAYLTVYYIFLNNTQIRASGTVGSEKGSDNDSTVTYLDPNKLKILRDMYLEQAKNLIAKFSVADFSEQIEPPDIGIPFLGTFSMKKDISW